ncbi:MAG: murein DD-endopeptidase MepM/ murein hydrolase activator NlpD [Nitriliruptoraceae bacterium]|jgi:murein DD-endopeptidase MepM/ murein hydrolase activator NlpD
MQVPLITPQLPTPPTAPVPSVDLLRATGFAARLADVAARRAPTPPVVGSAGSAGGVGAGTAPNPELIAAANGATTLGAMLRAGTSQAPSSASGAMFGVAGSATNSRGAATLSAASLFSSGSGPFAGHVATVSPVEGAVSSNFGPRVHPITGQRRDHDGLDIAAPTGTSVRAITDGTVVRAENAGGYGLLVEVDHGNGVITRYAHLSSIDVEVGQRLGVGGHLGAVGSTGRSTGPHLHVEVRVDGEPLDPAGSW